MRGMIKKTNQHTFVWKKMNTFAADKGNVVFLRVFFT
jgi:hypothetical protein